MNYTKFLIIFYVVLALPVWAQKKPTPRQITKVVAGSVRQRNPVLSPRELLPQYRSFITLNGRCPRCSFYDGSISLRKSQLSPQQIEEGNLSRRVDRLLRAYAFEQIPPEEQEAWKELKRLRDESTHSRKTIEAQYILAQTRQFIETHGRRPYSVIRDQQGNPIPFDKLTSQQHQERLLASQIYHLSEKDPENPSVIELRQLVKKYPNTRIEGDSREKVIARRQEFALQMTLKEIKSFVQRYEVRPGGRHGRKHNFLLIPPNAPDLREEQALVRRIEKIFRLEKIAGEPTAEAEQLREILKPYPAISFENTPMGIVPLLVEFVSHNHHLPRRAIKNERHITLTLEQQQEKILANRVHRVFEMDFDFQGRQAQALQTLHRIWEIYLPFPHTQFIEEIQAWSAAHGNTRPHVQIMDQQHHYIPFAQLTPQLQEEVMLGKELERVLKKIPEGTPERELLQQIYLLPMNQLPVHRTQKEQESEESYEEYF